MGNVIAARLIIFSLEFMSEEVKSVSPIEILDRRLQYVVTSSLWKKIVVNQKQL